MATPLANAAAATPTLLTPGQVRSVRLEQGQHYRVRRSGKGDGQNNLQASDDVIATRHGDALQLRYADGEIVSLDNFYSACQDSSVCSVNLPGKDSGGITLSADNAAASSTAADGGTLVYAHGDPQVLMGMAQGQPALANTFAPMVNAVSVSFLAAPPATETAVPASAASVATGGTGIAVVGLGALGLASGGGATAAATAAPAVAGPSTLITGMIVAGPVSGSNDLEVIVYKGDGVTILADHVPVNADGSFTANIGSYTGVVIAKLVNKGTGADFLDEATGLPKDINAALMSAGVALTPGAPITMNINPLTTIAAKKLSASPTAVEVATTNTAVAQAFGIADLNATITPTNSGGFNGADGVSSSERYGAVLAALSGMDKLNGGDMQATIDLLASKIVVNGVAASLDSSAYFALAAGAQTAATATNAPSGVTTALDSTLRINSALMAASGISNITAFAGSVPGSIEPTRFDYGNAGVSAVDSAAKLKLINDTIQSSKVGTDVDSTAEVQALADAIGAVVTAAAGGTAPNLAQWQLLGISGVTADNVGVINAAIAATADDASAIDTHAKLQTLVTNRVQAMTAAIQTIALAATQNSATTGNVTLGTYADAGAIGVTADNLAILDSVLNEVTVTGSNVDTLPEIQTMVSAYQAILAGADGAANGNLNLTAAQLSAIGVTGATDASARLLASYLDKLTTTHVDSVSKIQTKSDLAVTIITTAGGGTPITNGQLTSLGITGVTANNLAAIQAAIAATADDGSAVDTWAELQSFVNVAAISNAAQTNTATATLTEANYADAGVTGVTAANLGAINADLDTVTISGSNVDTLAKLQSLATAYQGIISGADGSANNNLNLTAAQYAAIGLANTTASSATLLNSVMDGLSTSAVDTLSELQTLSAAALAVVNAPGTANAPTQTQLQALGVTGISPDSLSAVQHAILNTTSADVDTLAELQAIATGAAAALTTISAAAQQNTATASSPSMATYTAAGVTGVNSGNVAALNTALNSSTVVGTSVSTYEGVQGLVDAYNAILASADGTDNVADTNNPAQASYATMGVTGVDSASKARLLGDVIDKLAVTAVDSTAEVQTLADTVATVISAAATGTAPTLAQLQSLGVTGVNSGNLAAVQAGIAATADDGTGVDTFAELQGVVNALAAQVAALSIISAYAQNNGGTAPTQQTYTDAMVTGVTNGSIVISVNSALASQAVTGSNVDTAAGLQPLANTFVQITSAADGVDNVNNANNPTQAQFAAIGVSGVNSAGKASLLGDAIDVTFIPEPMTVAYIQTLADAVNAVFTGAAGGAAPSIAQLYSLLPIQGVGITAGNILAIQNAIAATADDGSGVRTTDALWQIVSDTSATVASALEALKTAANGDQAVVAETRTRFIDAGIVGMDSGSWSNWYAAAIADALNQASVQTSASTSSLAGVDVLHNKFQGIADGYTAIFSEANGSTADATPGANPSYQNYSGLGVMVDQSSNINTLALLNDIVGGLNSNNVDTIAELNNLSRIANDIQRTAAGLAPTQALTAADFNLIGLGLVTTSNLQGVLATIAAQANDGSSTDTVDKINALLLNAPVPAAPTLNTVAGNNLVNASEAASGFAITGTGEAGATVRVFLPDSNLTLTGGNTAVVDSSGNWSVSVSAADVTAFGQGTETLRAGQTNAWGNNSAVVSTSITVDTTPSASPGVNANLFGDGTINATEFAAGVAITGTGEVGATVTTATLPGISTRTAVVGANGTWSIALSHADLVTIATYSNAITNNQDGSFAFAWGQATFTVDQTDTAGNVSATSASSALSFDTRAAYTPTISTWGGIINVQTVLQTGMAVTGLGSSGDTISLTLEGVEIPGATAVVDSSGHWTINITSANLGADVATFMARYTSQGISEPLRAVATNALGNTAISGTYPCIVDTVAPNAPTVSVVASDDVINTAEANGPSSISGTGTADDTINLVFSSGRTLSRTGGNAVTVATNGTWSVLLDAADIAAMGQGSEVVTATETDLVGNVGTGTVHTFSISTAPATDPTVNALSVGAVVDGAEALAGFDITGTGTAGDSLTLFIRNNANNTPITLAGGNTATWSGSNWNVHLTSADVAALGDGTISFAVTESNPAGNPNPNAQGGTFQIFTAAPTVSFVDTGTSNSDGITNTPTLTVSGTGASFQVSVDSGNWTTGLAFLTGTHTYSVRQADASGNVGFASAPVTVTYDPTPPVSNLVSTGTLDGTGNAVVQSNEVGTAYLVDTQLVVSSIYNISVSPDSQWNQVDITAINSDTQMSLAGLVDGTYALYTADAAGNLSTASSNTVTVNGAPVVNNVGLFSALGKSGDFLNAGDTLLFSLTFNEGITLGGPLSGVHLTVDIGGTLVEATPTTFNNNGSAIGMTLRYTIQSGQTDLDGVSFGDNALYLDAGTTLRDAAGHDAVLSYTAGLGAANTQFRVDTTPSTAIFVSSDGTNAVVQSNETGTAYLVSASVAVTNPASITGAADADFNSVAIGTANTDTTLSLAGLAGGNTTYNLYTVDPAGNLSTVVPNVLTVI